MMLRTLFGTVLAGAVVLVASAPAHAAPVTVTPMVRVMPLGDSITHGMGSSTDSSYRVELWRRLVETSGYGVDFVGTRKSGQLPDTDNEGHSGWTIAQVTAQVSGWLTTYKPDVVLLHIGTNDMGSDSTAAGAGQRLSALIDQIRGTAPQATVIVAQIVPIRSSAGASRVVAFNKEIPGIVASKNTPKVLLADLHSPLNPATDLADSLHPNDAGYVKMGAAWEQVTAPVLPVPRGITAQDSCVEAASAESRAVVHIGTCRGTAGQRWSRSGETLRAFGKCLDIEGARTPNGATLVLWPCHGKANQLWQLRADGSIYNPGSGRCLDIPGGDTTHGTRLIIWDCTGGANQSWAAR